MDEFSPAHPRLLQLTAPIQSALKLLIRFESSTVTTVLRESTNQQEPGQAFLFLSSRVEVTRCIFPRMPFLVFGMDLEVEWDYWTVCGRSYLQLPSCFSSHFQDVRKI
jgi:hypothetical protein